MKKILSILLIGIMVFSMGVLAFANEDAPGSQNAIATSEQTRLETRSSLRIRALLNYTDMELEELRERAEQIRAEHPEMTPINVENIVCAQRQFKFDTPPVIKEGRTLVPVRAMVEAYGADVSWNEASREVTIEIDGKTIVLAIGQQRAMVNGENVDLDVPAEIMNGRTIVPLRFILEHFGYEVQWEAETGTIEIVE